MEIIVPELPFAGEGIKRVDLTDLLLDWLKADELTRDILRKRQDVNLMPSRICDHHRCGYLERASRGL